jgi:hypothetical protein
VLEPEQQLEQAIGGVSGSMHSSQVGQLLN